MTPQVNLCPTCGAPLPATMIAHERCPFCQSEVRVDAPRTTPARPPGAPRPLILVIVGATVGLVALLALGGFLVALAFQPATIGPGASASPASPAPTAEPRISLKNLATTPIDHGWEAVDAPGMVGTFASFDPVANIEWARRIGAAWKPDATLYRLDLERVARDGLVDVATTPGASAEYRFTSPRCVAAYKSSTALVDPQAHCDLFLMVNKEGAAPHVTVLAATSSSPELALQDPVCTLRKAFAAVDAAGGLLPRPVYNVTLNAWGSDAAGKMHPAWILSTVISGQGELPTVDPVTCAVDAYWLKTHPRPGR